MTLPTPNLVLPESAGFNLVSSSPRHYKIKSGLNGIDRAGPSNGDREIMVKEEETEGMLTTPVLTTPKTGDIWSHIKNGPNDGKSPSAGGSQLGLAHDPHAFSPENLSVTSPTPIEIGPREPPKELPMDSEIGLRSPCDGILAQRRRERFRDKKQVSSLDSNSYSDTPTSENNSPRDLTMGSSKLRCGSSKSESDKSSVDGMNAGCDTSGVLTKSSNSPTSTTSPTMSTMSSSTLSNLTSSNSDRIPAESSDNDSIASNLSTSNHNNNILRGDKPSNIELQGQPIRMRVSPPPNGRSPISSHLPQRDFKLPSTKPENLRILNGNSSSNGKDGIDTPTSSDLPSHYTPSPLAVPSPNWTAVERYFGGEYVLKTPRLLDHNICDFLNPPSAGGTSGAASIFKFPRSPGNESDRYTGRDQRLSPRLSPRFPIPEAPTDLSSGTSRVPPNGVRRAGDPPPYAEAAEDLSMTKRQQKQNQVQIQQSSVLRMSSSPSPGGSDGAGGGPASNVSSSSSITPPSPLIYPPQSDTVPQQHLANSINRQDSPISFNGNLRQTSKASMFQQEPPTLISRIESNNHQHNSNQLHQLKPKYETDTKPHQLQQLHVSMQQQHSRARTASPHSNLLTGMQQQQVTATPPPLDPSIPIKAEVDDYEYASSMDQQQQHQNILNQRQVTQAAVALASGFANPYYLTQSFPSIYNRQQNQSIYSSHLNAQRPSPPTSAPPPKISPPPPLIAGGNHLPHHTRMSLDYNTNSTSNGAGPITNHHIRHSVSPYPPPPHAGHRPTWSTNPSPGPHIVQHPQTIQQCQSSNDIGHIQGQSMQPSWTTPSTIHDPSISPPSQHLATERGISTNAGISVKPTTALLNRHQGMLAESQNGLLPAEKRRGRKPGGPIAHDAINQREDRNGDNLHRDQGDRAVVKKQRKSGGKKSTAKAAGDENGSADGGNKRSYSCPHCQRSYDWNYNLNRHLKYECGKENAFQCAKCGRRFPHKQNCVYHLKRKHKIVCETIDQYVAAGLVVFHGNSNSAGQTSAKSPEEGGTGNVLQNSGVLPIPASQSHTQLQQMSTTVAPTRVV